MKSDGPEYVRQFLMNNASKKYLFVKIHMPSIRNADVEPLEISNFVLLDVIACQVVPSNYRPNDRHIGYALSDKDGGIWYNQYPKAVYPAMGNHSPNHHLDYVAINQNTGEQVVEVGHILNLVRDKIQSLSNNGKLGKASLLQNFFDATVRTVSQFGGIVHTNGASERANHFIEF